ncbi:MAG: hypothetical protein HQL50_10955 [Magnetococcales bacterium]|nr:hypothetical protein [Magnetococcales bacterium]
MLQEVQKARLDELATKGDLRELELRLEARQAEAKTERIKWVAGMLIAQTGLIITAFFVVARMLK